CWVYFLNSIGMENQVKVKVEVKRRHQGLLNLNLNLLLVRVLQRTLDVDHGQQHEDEGLDERYQDAHQHHRQRHQERGQTEEDDQHQLVAVHVAEQTQGEGDDPAEVTDHLDEEHHGSKPGDGAQEVLDVAGAVLLDTHDVGGDEDDDRAGRGGVDVGGRREEARHQPDQVRDQDEQGQGGDQREEGPAVLAHGVNQHVLDAAHDHFHEVLQPGGNRLQALGGGQRNQQQAEHDE